MLHIFKKTSKHTPAYSVCTNISFKINQNSLFDNVMNDTDAECYVRQTQKSCTVNLHVSRDIHAPYTLLNMEFPWNLGKIMCALY